jgi:transposase
MGVSVADQKGCNYHFHYFCSQVWLNNNISEKHISNLLKQVCENRQKLVEWMKSMWNAPETHNNKFVMMDLTRATSLSEQLSIDAKGYNLEHDYDKQVRLIYLFSVQLKQPVYFRRISGNITDSKSISLFVWKMNINNVIYIADKGFYSAQNIGELYQEGQQYIIPK